MSQQTSKKTHILIVDDEQIVRESLSGWLEKDGYSLATAPDGPTAVERVRQSSWSIVLVDLKMPGMDGIEVLEAVRRLRPETAVVIMTAYATVDTAVSAIKAGAFDYLVKPFDPEELSLMIRKIVTQQGLERENRLLRRVLRREHRFRDIYTKSPAMQPVIELARTAAASQSTILILGESGTGKELLARAVHAESTRASEPFVAVSCAALTETLLESELFGYEKGAFTGAQTRRQGKFEAADHGTLFLDEVGDISPKLQMDLLRVLEDRCFSRVGGLETVRVDVRVIAATNRDLARAMADGSFRQDLYYRLNVIPIQIPPLRDRLEDLPLLVQHFLEQLAAEQGREIDGLTAEAMDRLVAHAWPGNVRELRNVLERAVVVASGHVIEAADLGLPAVGPTDADRLTPDLSLAEVERRHIVRVLADTGGNMSRTARVLGIDRSTLYNKIRRHGIARPGTDDTPSQTTTPTSSDSTHPHP